MSNAVLGAHSGQRDSRNGQALERGASPRASFSSHGTTASIESGRYDRNSNEVVWRINMHANSALHHVGLIADVDPNTTITRVSFNNVQDMEKRGGSGNEYVYDIRHDKQRNLEATIEVHATVMISQQLQHWMQELLQVANHLQVRMLLGTILLLCIMK